jgi:hypothetical protein
VTKEELTNRVIAAPIGADVKAAIDWVTEGAVTGVKD